MARKQKLPEPVWLWLTAIITAILMAGLTFYVFTYVERYERTGPNILHNTGFEKPSDFVYRINPVGVGYASEWRISGVERDLNFDNGRAELINAAASQVSGFSQIIELQEGQNLFEVSAVIGIRGVVGGPKPWHEARVDFAGIRDNTKLDHNRPHVIFGGRGTKAPERYQSFFNLKDGTKRAAFAASLRQATGELTIEDIGVFPAAVRTQFSQMDMAVKLGWLGVFFLTAIPFWLTAGHRPAAVGAITLIGIVLCAGLLPTEVRRDLTSFLSGGEDDWLSRLEHFVFFVAVSFLICLARRRDVIIKLLFPLLLVAVGVELLQIITGSLGADDLLDVVINALGVVFGAGIANDHIKRRYGGRRGRRKSKRKSSFEDPSEQVFQKTK